MDRSCSDNFEQLQFFGLWNHLLPCSVEVLEHSVKIRLKYQFIQKMAQNYSTRMKIHSSSYHRLALKII